MKFAFIHTLAGLHPILIMCRLLSVSRSGYYARRDRPLSSRAQEDRVIKDLVAAIWERSGRIYGSPRVWAELRAECGIRCAR